MALHSFLLLSNNTCWHYRTLLDPQIHTFQVHQDIWREWRTGDSHQCCHISSCHISTEQLRKRTHISHSQLPLHWGKKILCPFWSWWVLHMGCYSVSSYSLCLNTTCFDRCGSGTWTLWSRITSYSRSKLVGCDSWWVCSKTYWLDIYLAAPPL